MNQRDSLMIFTNFLESITHIPTKIYEFITEHLGKMSAHTFGFITIILLHLSSVPTLLAVLTGQSDKMPPVDIMLFIWAGLVSIFFKSLFERNYIYVATICLGFVGQTVLMSLIMFK